MTTTARIDRRLGWTLLGAAILQVVAPTVQRLLDVSQPADGSEDLLVTPAGWTFSIWGLIYLLAIVHAVVTIRLGDGTGSRRFVTDLVALYVGAALWIGVSAVGWSWATFLVLVVMAGFAIDAAWIAARADGTGTWVTTLARATSGIYAGWVSAAVFLNLGTAAIEVDLADPADRVWQVILLAVAAVFALAVNTRMARSPGYAAAVAWAMVGVIAATAGTSTAAVVVAVVAIAALAVQTLVGGVRSRR